MTKRPLDVMIWNRAVETMPRPDLQRLQLHGLQETVARAYHRVPFYRLALDARGIKPEDIRALEDLRRLPFTVKGDLRDNYPFGLFAEPLEKIVRVHASSGTTGKPIVAGYTRHDLDIWTEVMARVLTSGSVTARDVVHNGYGHGLFTGGFGFHQGAERVGATVVPVASGMTKRQLMLIEDFGATVLCCTPSYALVIAEAAAGEGIDIGSRWQLRAGFFGAEPWSERMREEIEAKLHLHAVNIYGLTEIVGPGVSVECPFQQGMHIAEDHFLAEVIDPETGEPLGYGQKGELVFTTLTKEGMPMLRYRTRDLTTLYDDACPCGRTMARMERITGRTDDMLIIRGVNVFPSQIEWALLQVAGLEPQYVIVVDRQRDSLDELEIRVEAAAKLHAEGAAAMAVAQSEANRLMHQALGLSAAVTVVPPGALPRSEGKAKRVIDRREL